MKIFSRIIDNIVLVLSFHLILKTKMSFFTKNFLALKKNREIAALLAQQPLLIHTQDCGRMKKKTCQIPPVHMSGLCSVYLLVLNEKLQIFDTILTI